MRKPSARVRRGLLGVFVLLLIGGNIWVVRRQFPPAERRKNEAYDAGLRALTTQLDFAAAELHFRVFLEVDDRKPHVHYLLGLALQQQGKLSAAGEAFRAGIALNDNLDDARLALAEIAKGELDYLEALKQLNAAIAQDPTPASVYQYRGDLMVEIGDRAAALADYEETVRRDTVAYRAYLAMGDLLMSRGLITHSALDTNAAASHFRAAKEICLQRKTESNKREMLIAMAKAISGEVRTSQNRSLEEAIKLLEEVRDLDPDDPEPVLLLGDFFRRMGDNKEAERTLTSALRRWRTSAVFIALHDLYKDLDEFGKARTTLDDAIKEDSGDAGLRIRLIAYLVERGEFDEAEQEAERAGVLLGDDFRIHEALGDLATERSRRVAGTTDTNTDTLEELRAESLRRYEQALELRPQSLRLKKKLAGRLIESFLRRGEDAVPTEAEKQARTYLEDVLQVNRLDTEALAWKARFRLLDGEYEGVVSDLEPALKAPAPSLDALRILGVTAHRIGRDKLAVEAFHLVVVRLTHRNRASERDDRLASATDWRNLAGAELASGNLGAAKREARDGRNAWPSDRELTRLQAVAALRLGVPKQARDVLRETRQAFAGDVALRLLYAKSLEVTGDQKGAEREFRSALDEFPDKNTRARYFAYLARTGRASEAEDGFLALVASEPDDPEALLALGDFYVRQGPQMHALALVQYEKAFGLTEAPGSPLLRMVELHLIQAPRDPAALLAAQDAAARFANVLPDDSLNFYIRGKLALVQGQPEDALAELDRYLALRESDATGHFYRSRALRAARRLPEAQVALQRARTLAPEREEFKVEYATIQYELGVAAYKRGEFDTAQKLFKSAQRDGGGGARAELLMAGAQANLGNFDVSEKAVRDLLVREPENLSAVHLLAGILLQKQDKALLDEVELLYRRILQTSPDDLIAQVGVGTTQYQKGLFAEAAKTLRAAYLKTDGNVGVALALAQCMANGGDALGALEFINTEIAARPESHLMLHMKGDFLMHTRNPDLAVKAYLSAFEMHPRNDVALLAAIAALAETREYERARQILTQQLPKAKRKSRLRVALADMLLRLSRMDEAVEQLQSALAEQPEHPRALLLLGRVADLRGKKSDARQFYRASIQHRPHDAEPRLLLAQLLIADGSDQEAIDQYEEILRFAPRSTTALNNLAELLGRNDRDLDQAIIYAKKASVLDEDPLILDTLGWLRFRAGRLDAAVKNLQRAALTLDRNAKVQFHAGMAFARLKQSAEARRFLKRALLLDPKFAHADTARSELDKLK